MTPELEEFLRKEKCLTKFKKNADYEGENYIYGDIAGAFIWENTPEGVSYWLNLSAKFMEFT